MAAALIALVSSLTVKLKGDRVWEWKRLSQQKIGSLFISASLFLGCSYGLNSCHRQKEPFKNSSCEEDLTFPEQFNAVMNI